MSEVTPGGGEDQHFRHPGSTSPDGLAFDAAGNLYVANYANGTVREVTPTGGAATTFATGFSDPTAWL